MPDVDEAADYPKNSTKLWITLMHPEQSQILACIISNAVQKHY